MKNLKKLKIISTGSLLLLMGFLFLFACSKSDAKATESLNTSKASASVETKLPKLVDFKSPTCPPCRAMEPLLAELAVEYAHAFELELVDVSLPENRDRSMRNAIQYIPTQIFYNPEGVQVFRHTGYYSKEDILNKWKELGYDMSPKK